MKMTETNRSLARGFAGAGVGAGVGAFLGSSIKAASDLEEQMAKTQVVFGDSAKSVQDWSRTTSAALGLSRRQALGTASSFGALFAPMGIIGTQAADQSRKLTELGADLASFYNTDVQSALDAIRSGLVGESEPLRRYGALLSETRVQSEAMAETGKTTAAALTDQEKVLARINLIMRDTAQAHGDAARSGDRLAQQSKVLNAQLDDLKTTIGDGLTPGLLVLVDALNKTAGGISAVNSAFRGLNLDFMNHGIVQKGGLLDALGLPHFGDGTRSSDLPGGGNANFPIPGWTKGTGATGKTGAATAGSAMPFLNAIDNIVGFTSKWVNAGAKFAAAQKRFADAQKKAATDRARMQLQQQRLRAGRQNQLDWLDFGLERAESTPGNADNLRVLRKREALLKSFIAKEGRTLQLVRELWRTRDQIRDLNRKKMGASAFHQVSAAKVAGMLGVGGDRHALMLLAALGKGGTLPGGSAAFTQGRGGVVVNGNVHVHGVQNTRQFTDELEKQNRGRPAVRRGAR